MKKLLFSVLFLGMINCLNAQQQKITTVQYAGSMGYISLGVGITNKSGKVQHELLYGFVPKYYGGPLDKITYRLTYLPFEIKQKGNLSWRPINPVVFAAYNMGNQFSLEHSHKNYDQDYYWWSPALRFHVGANTALFISGKKQTTMLYLEANTNDRYITTYWDNTRNMSLGDLFYLGLGVKFLFNEQ